jgi:stringent starvation protein B
MAELTSTKPYLMRALYEWCVDNGCTPYVSVLVDSRTSVPMEYVREGEIVLNIGPLAASKLNIGNEFIECTARFSGVVREVIIPVSAVIAIYARESGQGMTFDVESPALRPDVDGQVENVRPEIPDPELPDPVRPGGKPVLRRVK